MPELNFSCPNCSLHLMIAEQYAEQECECPSCKHKFIIHGDSNSKHDGAGDDSSCSAQKQRPASLHKRNRGNRTKHKNLPADTVAAKDNESPAYLYGVLTEWYDERGYGFISANEDGKKIFLHIKALRENARRPKQGEIFFYKLTTDDRGRLQATDAFQTIFDEKQHPSFFYDLLAWLSYCWLLAVIVPLLLMSKTDSTVLGVCFAFIVNSCLTAVFYRIDKFFARNKHLRIPEKNLHIWALVCGWPGALYAQHVFRHKKSKRSFMIVFYCMVAINIIMLFVLFKFTANQL